MIYLSSFMLSNKQVKNPNIYPYNVFRGKYIEPFVFSPITVFYGNNGSGKSTLLNIIANKLQLKGKEYATSNSFGIVDYCNAFSNECSYSLGEDDFGFVIKQEEYIKFAQEKYSNGETSMQYFEEYLQPNALYLLDEPEVSLSPSNQVLLANEINKLARLLECQFVIATHSPFMLGTLNAKIYNIDTKEYDVVKWNELENVQYFYNFFKKHEQEFEEVIHESGERILLGAIADHICAWSAWRDFPMYWHCTICKREAKESLLHTTSHCISDRHTAPGNRRLRLHRCR